ncbi:small basic protein [PVC group bacterium]|nr:small basic protein [PVC group bacterium]
MSLHPSLKAAGQGKSHRNVLKKFERIELLKEQKRWSEGDSIFGIPKVRSIKLRKKKAAKTEEETDVTSPDAAQKPEASPQAPGAKPKS